MPTTVTETKFNKQKAEQFAERMMQTLNAGAMCLMSSIGHRTGLFDTLSGMEPSTSEEIAKAAKLNERYVREWLSAMVTGGIVDYDAKTKKYKLPTEHAAFLTRSAGADNIAMYTQYIPGLGYVEDEIVTCFKNGGGVPYEKFPRFHEVMAEDSGQNVVAALESTIIPMIPGLSDKLQKGIRVMDVGCGRGLAIMKMAELFPKSEFVGMDLSEEAITFARKEADRRGIKNAKFLAVDVTDFDETAEKESYDFITTFDAVHDQAKPMNVLVGIHRALKPDGIYLMQDINGSSHLHKDMEHPLGALLYTVSTMHCMTVSLAQGGDGLGTMWGEETTREYLDKAGFKNVETKTVEGDIMNNWYIVRK